MNWGRGISIFIIAFILFIAYLVYGTFQVEVPLVAENYYEKELNYQETINARNRLDEKGKVEMNLTSEFIEIQTPLKEALQGTLTAVCFNKSSQDFEIQVASDSTGLIQLSHQGIPTGQYEFSLLLDQNGTQYYNQQRIMIP